MFRKRDLSPLPEKRRLEQSSMCARDCFLVTSEHRSCSMKGALEEGRLVQGKTMRAVKEQSRLTIHWASLVLTCVQGETRNSVGMSYSLEEIVPCILPPLHSRHLTKAHLIPLWSYLLGESNCQRKKWQFGSPSLWPLEWGSEHQPGSKPFSLGLDPALGTWLLWLCASGLTAMCLSFHTSIRWRW